MSTSFFSVLTHGVFVWILFCDVGLGGIPVRRYSHDICINDIFYRRIYKNHYTGFGDINLDTHAYISVFVENGG